MGLIHDSTNTGAHSDSTLTPDPFVPQVIPDMFNRESIWIVFRMDTRYRPAGMTEKFSSHSVGRLVGFNRISLLQDSSLIPMKKLERVEAGLHICLYKEGRTIILLWACQADEIQKDSRKACLYIKTFFLQKTTDKMFRKMNWKY